MEFVLIGDGSRFAPIPGPADGRVENWVAAGEGRCAGGWEARGALENVLACQLPFVEIAAEIRRDCK